MTMIKTIVTAALLIGSTVGGRWLNAGLSRTGFGNRSAFLAAIFQTRLELDTPTEFLKLLKLTPTIMPEGLSEAIPDLCLVTAKPINKALLLLFRQVPETFSDDLEKNPEKVIQDLKLEASLMGLVGSQGATIDAKTSAKFFWSTLINDPKINGVYPELLALAQPTGALLQKAFILACIGNNFTAATQLFEKVKAEIPTSNRLCQIIARALKFTEPTSQVGNWLTIEFSLQSCVQPAQKD